MMATGTNVVLYPLPGPVFMETKAVQERKRKRKRERPGRSITDLKGNVAAAVHIGCNKSTEKGWIMDVSTINTGG